MDDLHIVPVFDEGEIRRGFQHLHAYQGNYIRKCFELELPFQHQQFYGVDTSTADIEYFADQVEANPESLLAIDIEWIPGKHLRMVGFVLLNGIPSLDQTCIVVLRDAFGNAWHPTSDQVFVDTQLRRLLYSTNLKIFHNAVADLGELARYGFEVRGETLDTMWMHYYAHPTLRKSLEFCSVLWCGASRWKHRSKPATKTQRSKTKKEIEQ